MLIEIINPSRSATGGVKSVKPPSQQPFKKVEPNIYDKFVKKFGSTFLKGCWRNTLQRESP
jgi:hypothetical protein